MSRNATRAAIALVATWAVLGQVPIAWGAGPRHAPASLFVSTGEPARKWSPTPAFSSAPAPSAPTLVAAGPTVPPPDPSPPALPRTGADLWLEAALGLLMLATGLVLRTARSVSRRRRT